ncbi:venom allergen 5-like [Ruditapes philippinarum]|uniref:venom allergen 5-like n=1 Tax=Ruditapes philippinarum TaxID=129788 RepID=UPI00295B5A64|nr:venom allergen 5-like [Ruditapes philippinarum]
MNKVLIGLFIFALFLKSFGEMKRMKREARECKDKFKMIVNHSACRERSPLVQKAGVSDAEKNMIVSEHNKYRKDVNPPATDMLRMTWDAEVALVAQAWAETCSFGHDETQNRNIPGRLSAGQNIGKGYKTWEAAIKAWNDEVKDFTYNGKNAFHKVGHYTQLVWATSSKIGCGMADCGGTNFHVCNYSPAGNFDINKPYKSGKNCGACGNCKDKLCDCGEKVCENGGDIDTNTCNCKCKQSFHIGDFCQLDCRNLTEPFQCGTGSYDANGCVTFSTTVPFECPKTCHVCPTGGFNYTEGTYVFGNNGGMLNTSGYELHLAALIVLGLKYSLQF